MPKQPLFIVLYVVSIAAVVLGVRRFLRHQYYTLEDWRHYRIYTYLAGLNFESLEKMRLLQKISIEKYLLKRRAGHITYTLIFGGLGLFALALALAAVWVRG